MRIFLLLFFSWNITASLAQDHVRVSASNQYSHPSSWGLLFMGRNYRRDWNMPVSMPVFHLQQTQGGFAIKSLGGGQQTKSLRLVDKRQTEWVLRTVDKNVENAMPWLLRHTIAQKLVQKMVSASHPYAPMVVGKLARVLGLHAPDPQLYFVPADTAFGKYQSLFAGQVCMLEQADPTIDGSTAIPTTNFLKQVESDNTLSVDDRSFLKARLLDFLVADWDRHREQWRWAKQRNLFYPIPRDRDQAFFYSDGLFLRLIRLFSMQHLAGFTSLNTQLNDLNSKAWEFDKMILYKLDEKSWRQIIHDFQQKMSNAILSAAVKNLPAEIYAEEGAHILQTLEARRDHLASYGMAYYRFLSTQVCWKGSAKKERYELKNNGDQVLLEMKDYATGRLLGKRLFDPHFTQSLTLEGFGGDELIISPNFQSNIKMDWKDEKGIREIRGK